jgi:hypothetical protein
MIHGSAARSATPRVTRAAAPRPLASKAAPVATVKAPAEPALPVLRLAIAVAAIFAFGALAPMIAAAAR